MQIEEILKALELKEKNEAYKWFVPNMTDGNNQLDALLGFTTLTFVFGGNRPIFDAFVKMSDGSKKDIMDITIGDEVLAWDGEKSIPSKVIDIPFDGEIDGYKITTKTGTSFGASDDHCFPAYLNQFQKKSGKYVKATVIDIANAGWKYKRLLNGGVQEFKETKTPFSGFLLGLYLGDGSYGDCPSSGYPKINFTNARLKDIFKHEFLKHYPESRCVTHPSDPSRMYITYSEFANDLKEIGLASKKAPDKFIPDCFKYGSVEIRKEVLRGLFLTDGGIDSHKSTFWSSSRTMMEDIQEIISSLGGYSKMYKDGSPSKTQAQAYKVQLSNQLMLDLDLGDLMFKSPPSLKRESSRRDMIIKSIENVGKVRGRCITIDHPSHYFLIEDGIVTSNSGKTYCGAIALLGEALGWHPEFLCWFEDVIRENEIVPMNIQIPTKFLLKGNPKKVPVTKEVRKFHQLCMENESRFFLRKEDRAKGNKLCWVISKDTTQQIDAAQEVLSHYLPDDEIKRNSRGERQLMQSRGAWIRAFLKNSSKIELKTYEQGREHFQGANVDYFWSDEECPEPVWNEVLLRIVQTKGRGMVTMTPLKGLTFMFDRYYEPFKKGEDTYPVFMLDSTKNPHLDSEVLQEMVKGMSEQERRARLSGEFVSREGLVYPEFNREIHLYKGSPPDCIWFMGLDHGADHPTGVVWVGIDKDRKFWIDKEYKEIGSFRMHAAEIHKVKYTEKARAKYIDPSAKQAQIEFGYFGLHFQKGVNDREAGISIIRGLFADKRIFINENCIELIHELEHHTLRPASRLGEHADGSVIKKNDDCFVAGTMIATPFGDRPIETLRQGDLVITPYGYRKVLKNWKTGIKEVIKNRGLNGTPTHHIFLNNKFVNLDTIRYNSSVSYLTFNNLIKWKYKKLLYSMASPTDLWVGKRSTILVSQKRMKGGSVLRDFMWRSGNFITKQQYKKAMSFTIKTVILSIMTSVTLSVLRVGNIYRSILRRICKTMNLEKRLNQILINKDHSQRYGTLLKKEEDGIVTTQKPSGRIVRKLTQSVCNVARRLNAGIKALSSAQTTVNQSTEEQAELIMKSGSVYSAKKNLQLTNTLGQSVAQEYALKETYNLTIEEDHVYYANGILVGNCLDALRYCIASRPEASGGDKNRMKRGFTKFEDRRRNIHPITKLPMN